MPPKPTTPVKPSKYDLRSVLQQAGFSGPGLETAYKIALAESGGRARALNDNPNTGDKSYGLFQINMIGKMGEARAKQYGLKSYEDLYDPLTNAKAAYRISKGGTNFKPWTTYTSGKYKGMNTPNKSVEGPSIATAGLSGDGFHKFISFAKANSGQAAPAVPSVSSRSSVFGMELPTKPSGPDGFGSTSFKARGAF